MEWTWKKYRFKAGLSSTGRALRVDRLEGRPLDLSDMGVKKGFALASLACFLRPFLIGAAALGLGLGSEGSRTQGFLRFLVFPHLLPAVCFAFLAWDENAYAAYRPLAALALAGSTLALILSFPPILASLERGALESGSYLALARAGLSALGLILIDLVCLILLIPRRKRQLPKES